MLMFVSSSCGGKDSSDHSMEREKRVKNEASVRWFALGISSKLS